MSMPPNVGTAHSQTVVGHEKPTDKQLPPKTWLVSGQLGRYGRLTDSMAKLQKWRSANKDDAGGHRNER